MFFDPHLEHASGVSRATVTLLQSAQCHAGMRCPHQSWREIHQSRMLYIHSKYVFDQLAGTNLMSPFSTALMAGSASRFIRIHHCFDNKRSTMGLQRLQLPTLK